jgi:hypothetical protein
MITHGRPPFSQALETIAVKCMSKVPALNRPKNTVIISIIATSFRASARTKRLSPRTVKRISTPPKIRSLTVDLEQQAGHPDRGRRVSSAAFFFMPVQGPTQPEPLEELQVAAQEQRWCP